MQFTSRVPDPVWGSVPVTELERQVLQHWSLRRLAQIKQMGLAFLDYPGLTHTRLEHSIGVMHVADRIFGILYANVVDEGGLRDVFEKPGYDRVRQAVRLAALMHDLGHPPFSHAVETAFLKYPGLLARAGKGLGRKHDDLRAVFRRYSHEAFSERAIVRLLSQATLRSLLAEAVGEKLLAEIPSLAVGRARTLLAPFNPIISGDFDADRIDYLIRDNRQSGFQIALELDELHGAMYLRRTEVPIGTGARNRTVTRYDLVIGADALPFVNSVLAARHRLIRRVHLARYGRAASQMMAACLFEVFRNSSPARLRDRITRMHEEWTDFTFFAQLKAEIGDQLEKGAAVHPLARVLLETAGEVNNRPIPERAWEDVAHVTFMEMHPCLRLLVHAAAGSDWGEPSNHTFADGGEVIVVEPSAKPSRASDLMAEYGSRIDRGRDRTSLDYFGATENRLGRAIVVEAMSNVDIFAYRASRKPLPGIRPLAEGSGPRWREVYWDNLKGINQRVARAAAGIATRARERWPVDEKGMIAADYLLAALHCLERQIDASCEGARGIYVYASGLFVNRFIPGLATGVGEAAAALFPALFRQRPGGDGEEVVDAKSEGKEIFSQIQRLAAFGLVLVRSNSVIHARRDEHSRATRTGVFSTREEIRINTWGRFYVEREIPSSQMEILAAAVNERQAPIVSLLREMSAAYRELDSHSHKRHRTSKWLAELENRRALLASRIHARNGCAMTFSLPAGHPRRARADE